MLILAATVQGFAQSTVVEWTFPNNPDDAFADGGASYNLNKTITTQGGAGTPTFDQSGLTTNCASAQSWSNGALTKYWQVEFSTLGFGDLTFESQLKSFSSGDFGPRDFLVQYRIGGSSVWTTLITFVVPVGNHWFQIPPTPLPVTCDNKSAIFIRWIMFSNTPTQGSGLITDNAYSRLDDIRILSYCPIPLVTSFPATQAVCSGSAITPIVLTDTNNVPGTTFTWVRDNTTVLTGMPASGSGTPITGTLYSSNPSTPETTSFTITATANGCSSTTTATVTVMDDQPPFFLSFPDSIYWCVQDIVEAWWDGIGDITPERPDYHTFYAGGT
ncbi:PKD-like domain-containing protein, partial [Bacteroidota bacterium]